MLQSFRRTVVVYFCFFLVSAELVFAQTGQISGHVSDIQGAVVTGAAVRVIAKDATLSLSGSTDAEGAYKMPLLPAGVYQVIVESEGFKPFVSKPLHLNAGQAQILDVTLSVASSNTSISVSTGGISTIETSNAELSGTISEQEVRSFGLNGRVAMQLIALTPGVSNQTGQDEGKTGVAGSAKYSVNGGRVQYNIFEVDGTDVLNNAINASRGGNTFVVNPSVDAIAEMKVLTSNYGAMYGRTASGIVQITTKSGTQDFHGNLYEFLRNEAFNARNYFDETKSAPLYRRQDFGGTIGGPLYIPNRYNIKKDKTYFFFSEEARLEKTPVQYNQGVPSLAERSGDFNDVCPSSEVLAGSATTATDANGNTIPLKSAYPDCPIASTDVVNPSNYDQFQYPFSSTSTATNILPVDPTSKALLATGLLPKPNAVTGCNSTASSATNPSCYVASVSPDTYFREELFRIDHNLTPSQLLGFRYIHDTWNTTVLTPQWGMILNSFPTVRNYIDGPGLSLMGSLAGNLGHGFQNRLTVGYVAEHITLTTKAGPGVQLDRTSFDNDPAASQLGQMGSFFSGNGDKLPGLVFKGTNQAYGGKGFSIDTGYAPWSTVNPTYSISDDVARLMGRHSLQFGVQLTYAQQNEQGAANGLNSGDVQGVLSFNDIGSPASPLGSAINCTHCTAGFDTTNAFANFLGDQIYGYQQDSAAHKYYNRYQSAEPYLQDNWRISPRLTLNLGFRAGLFGSWYNAKGTAYNWVPSAFSPSLAGEVFPDPYYGYLINSGSMKAVSLDVNNVDPHLINGMVRCGSAGVPKSCMSSHVFNPMPRIGFAWDIFGDGKTSVRGGYGIFYEHGTSYESNSGSLTGSAPETLSESVMAPSSYQCLGGYNSKGGACYSSQYDPISLSAAISGPVAYPLNVTSIPTKAVYPYSQQWSLSFEHELPNRLFASLAYVGSKGTHLTAVRDLNQVKPVDGSNNPYKAKQPMNWLTDCSSGTFSIHTAGASGGVVVGPGSAAWDNMSVACYGAPNFGTPLYPSLFRPLPTMGSIMSVANTGDSRYNAFQLSVRRSAAPLVLGIAYTYSHSIDDSSDRSDANFVNSYDLSMNKASSSFDIRHNAVISYVYDLPLRKALQNILSNVNSNPDSEAHLAHREPTSYLASRTASLLLDNWQLSGITLYQTGTPFSIINGGSTSGIAVSDNAGVANYYGTGSYADCVSPGYASSAMNRYAANTVGPLLQNPAAYVAPQGLTFGNCGRNSANNPSRLNFNMSALKHFKLTSKGELELRAEAFNVFNHTQFRIYDPAHPGSTGNNIIGCYGGASTGYSAAGGGGQDCSTGISFLHPIDAHDPRIMQFGAKLSF